MKFSIKKNKILRPVKKKNRTVYNKIIHEPFYIEHKNKLNWFKRNHEYINTIISLLLALCTIILAAWGNQLSKNNIDLTNRQNAPVFVAMGLNTSNPEILNQGGPIREVHIHIQTYIRFHSSASLLTSENYFDYYLIIHNLLDSHLPSYNYSSNSFAYSYKYYDRQKNFLNILTKRIKDENFIPNLNGIMFIDSILISYTDYSGIKREEYYINNGFHLEKTSRNFPFSNGRTGHRSINLYFTGLDGIDIDALLSNIKSDYDNYKRQGYLPIRR